MPPTCTYRCSYGPLALLLTLALAHDVYDAQAQPQPFRFEHLTVEDGLPDASVFSILQDRLGFLWLGTGNGLVRYDGYTLKVFAPDPNNPHSIGRGRIRSLYEDEHGSLWASTAGDGLFRFDRVTERFTRYGHDPEDPHSLTTDQLTRLTPDGKGYIWAETNGAGLNRVEVATGRITRFRHTPEDPGSLSDDLVHDLIVDRQGAVWAGTSHGLNRLDEASGRFIHYRHDPNDPGSLSHDMVYEFAEDKEGRLWVGTEGGLDRFDPATERFIHYRHNPGDPNSLGHDTVRTLLAGRDGMLWVGTEGGLDRLDPSTGRFTHYLPRPDAIGTPHNRILDVYEDRTGLLWVRTADPLNTTENFYIFDPTTERFAEYADDPDDPSSISILGGVHAMFEDRTGILWIGTWMGGLNKLDRSTSKFRHYAHPAGEGHSSEVSALYEDRQGQLWVATGIINPRPRDVGLHLLDRTTGQFTHYRLGIADPEQMNLNFVFDMYEDRSGQLWLLTAQGLRRFDPSTGLGLLSVPHPEPPNPRDNTALKVFEDTEGLFWVGLYSGGLVQFDPTRNTFTRYYRHDPDDPHSLPANRVNDIHEDEDGQLWLATGQGPVLFDPVTERFTLYEDTTLGRFNARTLHEDRQGYLWLTTWPRGLVRFDRARKTFRAFMERQGGTASNSTHALLEDEGGVFWITSNQGLARFDPRSETFRHYDADDGLGGNDFNVFAALKTRDGELYVGGPHGLNAFFPDEVHDNPHPPQVTLTGLRIFDEPVLPNAEGPLHTPIAEADEIRLGHRQNDVTFEYVGLHFSRPEENRYAYMLDGYESEWRHVGTQRTAIYPNLPPGDYTFRVKAANYDGVWDEQGTAVRLIVVPPWWQHTWFHVLLVLGLLALVYAGYRLRVRQLRTQARKLQEEVDVRTRELVAEKQKTEAQALRLADLDEAKSRFFANISHEFRTPLTLLLSPLDEALEGTYGVLPAPMQRQVHVMRRNARRLLRLVGQLLDLSKLESGRMELKRLPGDLVPFLRELVRSFTPLAERHRITLQFRPAVEAQPLLFDRDALEKVFSNLLSNALKFTPGGGRVWLTLTADQGPGGVEVVVKDTGPGIPPSELERIFDRFEQVDASTTRAHEGTGLGLALARELVELHGGTLRVESELGAGSAFLVRLPLDVPAKPVGAIAPDGMGSGDGATGEGAAGDGASALEHAVLAHDSSEQGEHPTPTAADDRPLVLVVEDNADVRALLHDYLRSDYRVLEAPDGQAGLEAVHAHHPALVVSDVMMPRIDGYELCRRIKADEALRATPVILLTAKAAEADRIYGLEGGADDYVSKPFSRRELLVRITNLILSRRQLRAQYSREVVVRPSDVVIEAEDEALLERVLEVLERHLGDSGFSVDQLADEVGLSRRQMYRRVKAITGETPAELLRRLRLERAVQLLEAHPGTIAEVAYAVGFTSPAHFSTAFRKHFGTSPSEHIAEGV